MLPWKWQVLVKLWAGTNDLVTVGAFLCLRQLIHCNPQSLEPVAKVTMSTRLWSNAVYFAYSNCI